jgi:Ca2+-binding EF-hand superfamily protein
MIQKSLEKKYKIYMSSLVNLLRDYSESRKRDRSSITTFSDTSNSTATEILQRSEKETRAHLADIYERRTSSRPKPLVPRFHLSSSSNGEYAAQLRDATHERFVRYKSGRLLDGDELEQLIILMRENLSPPYERENVEEEDDLSYDPMRPPRPQPPPPFEGLNYDSFQRVGSQLSQFPGDGKYLSLFSPSTFLQFRRDKHGRVSLNEFYEYACRHRDLCEERITLSHFDPTGDGHLREVHLESYFFDFINRIPSLRALQEDFNHFYVFTAVRKFFFFLDRQGQRKLASKDILSSPVFGELHELRQQEWDEDLPRCQENWFSARSSLRVYREYLELDVDQNGMLSKEELSRYSNGSLTTLFVERIWQEYRTYRSEETGQYEMDYKQFLDFTLAMENQKTPQSLQWFWRILDVDKNGYIDAGIVKMFFNQVLAGIAAHNQPVEVNCLDVCDEIFDMAKPKHPCRITLKDLIACGVGDTIVTMLVDVTEFLSYDTSD